jgi:hypothetical protein
VHVGRAGCRGALTSGWRIHPSRCNSVWRGHLSGRVSCHPISSPVLLLPVPARLAFGGLVGKTVASGWLWRGEVCNRLRRVGPGQRRGARRGAGAARRRRGKALRQPVSPSLRAASPVRLSVPPSAPPGRDCRVCTLTHTHTTLVPSIHWYARCCRGSRIAVLTGVCCVCVWFQHYRRG